MQQSARLSEASRWEDKQKGKDGGDGGKGGGGLRRWLSLDFGGKASRVNERLFAQTSGRLLFCGEFLHTRLARSR